MEITELVNLISSMGAPVAFAAALFWYMTKQDAKRGEEISKITEALNNNTIILTKLCERLGEGVK